ncbi:hypothetical protein C8J57DRAFT_1538616 [Mycena rebaudengoi]|nr:hypothetical protein C8J57DRAFT_1538616 [Mycena rebaudengoi]
MPRNPPAPPAATSPATRHRTRLFPQRTPFALTSTAPTGPPAHSCLSFPSPCRPRACVSHAPKYTEFGNGRHDPHCMALCGAGLSWLLTDNVSAHFAASHRYSAACTHLSILVSLPFPSDAPSPTALTRWPKMIYLIRPPRSVHPGSRQIFLKPSEAYSTKSALYLNLSHSLVRPELRSGYQLQYPCFVCLFLSFYTPPSSCLLGALGRVPYVSPHPKMQLQRLPWGTICAPTQRRLEERDLDDFWKSPAVQVRYICISPFIFAFCRRIDLAPHGYYYGAHDFIPGELPYIPSTLPRSPHHLLRLSDAFLRAIFAVLTRAATHAPPKRSADLIFRLIISTLAKSLTLSFHSIFLPSYNDGPGLTPHRLHGDAALKSVVATGLYLLESSRAADLKRARLLTDPWGARARAGAVFQMLQELWAAVLSIIVACTMLWHKAGFYVMCAPLIFIAALIGCTSSISRFVGAAQKAWHKTVDVRIKLLLLTSTIAAVPRTLGKDVCTEVALRRWCSSDEALANNPSPTKTGIIRGWTPCALPA